MQPVTRATRTATGPLARSVRAAFWVPLLLTLVLAPTVFGNLHRYGDVELLLVVSLLLALWVVSSLVGVSFAYVRSAANVCIWGLLGLAFLQVLPLPKVGLIGQSLQIPAALREVLVNSGFMTGEHTGPSPAIGRYSLQPSATMGVLILWVSAAGLFWVVGSGLVGRKALRRATWAVTGGLVLLGFWVLASGLKSPAASSDGVSAPVVLVHNLGGDSLVPALLAALPLGVMIVLRQIGWMPRRRPDRRQGRFRWLGRPGAVWAAVALAATGLAAAALGACNVRWPLVIGCELVSVGFVAIGYVGRAGLRRPRAFLLALVLLVWIVAATGAGMLIRGPGFPASSADERLEALWGGLGKRTLLGTGAGTISPTAAFGDANPPVASGGDGDTNGYRLLLAELGAVGLFLTLGAAGAMAVHMMCAWRRARSPWTRLAPLAGLGVLSANAAYFAFDASAVLTSNLLAIAGVLGVVTAWSVHGADWRPERRRRLGAAHWPLVVGAVGLTAALTLAENEMLGAAAPGVSDKILHFGTFAVISLVLCYALGPQPGTHYLRTRILLAVSGTAFLGVAMEYGQRWLTAGRVFEPTDIVANLCGAGLMGLFWWIFRRGQVDEPHRAY